MTKRSAGWLLHALLLAVAFVVLAYPLALDVGLIAGAVGAVAGTLVAETMVANRYRVWVTWAFGFATLAVGWFAAKMLLASSAFALALTPEAAIHVGEMLRWSTTALGACVILRATALRFRVALAVEGSVAVAAVVSTVAAHRDGMIVRPFSFADWFWQQGLDPVVAFLGVGIGASLLLAGLLLHGRSRSRGLIQLLLVLLLAVVMAQWIRGRDPSVAQKNAVGGPLKKSQDDPSRKGGSTGGGSKGGRSEDQQNSDLPEAGQQGRNRPAAVVLFHRDVQPSGGIFYFRHAAFSQFNGSRLVQTTLAGVDPDARSDFPLERRPVEGVPENALGRTEVATDVALLTRHSRMFVLTDATEVAPKANPDPARFQRAYSVVSEVVTGDLSQFVGQTAGHPKWTDRTWELYTELPRDDRYHQLAASLQSRLREEYNRSPLALALMVKKYLEETTTYSFARKYQGDEPTAEFLFSEDRKGYCVHLAHAAAYLMRALGLPARVSAGYAVEARNMGSGSSLLIKQGDAHAWAELYLQGLGWVPIEIAPEKTEVEPTPFQERDLQQMLGEMARRESHTERVPASAWPVMKWLRSAWNALPWVFLGLLVLAYIVKAWRAVAPHVNPRRPKLAYRAALDRLSAVGWIRDRGEPRERFATRVADVTPSLKPLTAGLTGYVLGSVESPESRAGAPLARLARAVGGEVRRSTPTWRWLLGALNPISWWWSR